VRWGAELVDKQEVARLEFRSNCYQDEKSGCIDIRIHMDNRLPFRVKAEHERRERVAKHSDSEAAPYIPDFRRLSSSAKDSPWLVLPCRGQARETVKPDELGVRMLCLLRPPTQGLPLIYAELQVVERCGCQSDGFEDSAVEGVPEVGRIRLQQSQAVAIAAADAPLRELQPLSRTSQGT